MFNTSQIFSRLWRVGDLSLFFFSKAHVCREGRAFNPLSFRVVGSASGLFVYVSIAAWCIAIKNRIIAFRCELSLFICITGSTFK